MSEDRKARILFVDDEEGVRDALREAMHRERRRWEVEFAGSGDEALRKMDESPCDVVISDMRMPGMDGASLLTSVRRRYPATIRMILTGHSEDRATIRAIPVTQQWLSKPCDRATLVETLERALAIKQILVDPKLEESVGGLTSLPSAPTLYTSLVEAVEDPATSVQDVAQILEKDPALCAKVLQVVNSSFFCLPRKTVNVHEAVSFLGFRTVSHMVLSVEICDTIALSEGFENFSFEKFHAHSLLTGRIASRMFPPESEEAEQAFTAGVLHDVGLLIMASRLRDGFVQAIRMSEEMEIPLHIAEERVFDTTHSEIGAYLLGAWGLPMTVVEAVAHHHYPSRAGSTRFDVVGAVAVGNVLASQIMDATVVGGNEHGGLDLDYLGNCGVLQRIHEWRAIAEEEVLLFAGGSVDVDG